MARRRRVKPGSNRGGVSGTVHSVRADCSVDGGDGVIRKGSGEFTFYVEVDDGKEVPITVKWRGYSDSGQLSGPPENCYPPEGEMELEYELPSNAFDSAEKLHEQIEQMAYDNLMEYER
jgi:hypothetical protein